MTEMQALQEAQVEASGLVDAVAPVRVGVDLINHPVYSRQLTLLQALDLGFELVVLRFQLVEIGLQAVLVMILLVLIQLGLQLAQLSLQTIDLLGLLSLLLGRSLFMRFVTGPA